MNRYRRIILFVCSIFLMASMCGCFALLAGGAVGAGTAIWLSNKLTQQFNASYERTVSAAESALKSLKLVTTKEARESGVTQLRSTYANGKEVWVDIRRITENSTKVEVRVGAVSPDKEAATTILKRIKSYL